MTGESESSNPIYLNYLLCRKQQAQVSSGFALSPNSMQNFYLQNIDPRSDKLESILFYKSPLSTSSFVNQLPVRSAQDMDMANVFLQGSFEIVDNAMIYSFHLKQGSSSTPLIAKRLDSLTCILVQMIRLASPADTARVVVHYIDATNQTIFSSAEVQVNLTSTQVVECNYRRLNGVLEHENDKL
jgi:hypothetical protein